ncbi:sulfopyruvate decarboxylase TPP-binding subunit [Roseovarius sp. MBR-79]|jgi:sulfopyruvate decarboxylase subunit alpha
MTQAQLPDHPAQAVTAPNGEQVLQVLRDNGVGNVVTVSDWVQLPLQRALDTQKDRAEAPTVRVQKCTTEDEAFLVAAGLHIGGQRSVVVIQNQGLYAGLNALRGIGLDSNMPLVIMIGQFGREPDNFGQPTTASSRRIVRILEPLLELLDIPYWKVETTADLAKISEAYSESERRSWPAAVIFDRNMAWQ